MRKDDRERSGKRTLIYSIKRQKYSGVRYRFRPMTKMHLADI